MTTTIGSATSYPALAPDLTDSADIQAALRILTYGTYTDPANDAAIAVNSLAGYLAKKANLASPTFTGTVNGITKSMVGLGNVDNTSDANKPVSTATTTALNLKANLASPTFTGTVTFNSVTQGPTSSIVALFIQPAPNNKTTDATLTIAEILKGIVTVSGTGNKTLTLPTGTLSDAGILSGAAPVRTAFDWSIVNNSGAGIDVAAATNHTLVPASVSLQDGSGSFRTVKTATNTFITYWLGR